MARRVARIWKRGGFFERVRKVQTTLTRIFIVLESVLHGLFENLEEISRKAQKFKGFFRPKSGGLQKKKKKKVFAEIETGFSAEIPNSNVFSAQIQVVSKKKKVFAEIETGFLAEIPNSNVFSAQNQVVSKKKEKVFTEIQSDLAAKYGNFNV